MTVSPRTRRHAAAPLAAIALLLTACGGGDDGEDADDPGADPAASTSAAADVEAGPTSDLTELQAACTELEAVITGVTAAFPGGVGLAADEVPGAEQVEAVEALVDGVEAVDVPDEELAGLVDDLVAAGATIIDRAGADEPLTADDEAAFIGALDGAGARCAAA